MPAIPGFRVIDCLDETVVTPASGCEFVALSYVWGPAKPVKGGGGGVMPATSTFRLNTLPCVVRDAMEVTLGLGFRYLWVDRYLSSHPLLPFHVPIQVRLLTYPLRITVYRSE